MVVLESARVLKERGVGYRVIELKDRAISVEDVIRFSKEEIRPEEICKTIILKDRGGSMYAVFLLGDQRIDIKKARQVIGGKVSIASFREVKKTTGVEPGAVCPLLVDIPVLVDRRVLTRERLNFGSGNHLYGLEIRSEDLAKVVDYRVVDVAEAEASVT